jgi:Pretoxin HINT domain
MKEVILPPRWHPKPPPRLPGKPARGDIDIEVSELGSFLRCRRAWDIASPGRRGLSRKGIPSPALHIGSAVHFALAAQALGEDYNAAIRQFFAESRVALEEQYRSVVGTGFSPEELDILDEQRRKVILLVGAYFEKYGTKFPTRPYRIIAPEVTFRVRLLPDQPVYLVGTFDRVMADEFGAPVPGEIKTYKTKPRRVNWQFNHQLYGYAAVLQLLTGEEVPYATYDGIRKVEPTIPQVLKNGDVSKRWIDTTHDVYLAEVRRVHGGEVPSHYKEMLQRLRIRDRSNDNAFVTRFRIPISQYAIARWWDRAQLVASEIANFPLIYPYFDWQGCPFCFTAGHLVRHHPDVSDPRVRSHHFAAGTDGRSVGIPIEELRKGDRLLAYDDVDNQVRETRVVETSQRRVTKLMRIGLASGRKLTLTPEHPVYVSGVWLRAEQLRLGDEILELNDFPHARHTSPDHYSYAHRKLRNSRGPASAHPCIDCGKQACDWSQIHGTDGLDLEKHYVPRCRVCHQIYDGHPFVTNGDEVVRTAYLHTERDFRRAGIEPVVYNIQCHPYENFFVNGLLAHNCRVKDLCHAIEGGDNHQLGYLLKHEYATHSTPTRRAIAAGERIATLENITCLEDFAAWSDRKTVRIDLEEDSDVDTGAN